MCKTSQNWEKSLYGIKWWRWGFVTTQVRQSPSNVPQESRLKIKEKRILEAEIYTQIKASVNLLPQYINCIVHADPKNMPSLETNTG